MSFSRQVAAFSRKTKVKRNVVIEKVFRDISTIIVSRTPVGDITLWASEPRADYRPGSLANNWFSGHGNMPTSFGRRGASTVAGESLGNVNATAPGAPGRLAWLVNPLPYIEVIEYNAWSSQAPSGMVRLTILKFGEIVKKAAASVN